MVTLCVLVAVLRTRSSWPGFVHASSPAGDGEADYKHDVISLSILISLKDKNALQIPKTMNSKSLVLPVN